MIPFEEMDRRLEAIGKDRSWLAEETKRSPDHIRTLLAPNSTRRSEKVQALLSDAIVREERRQRNQGGELAPGMFQIFQTEEQLARADQASRYVHAKSLADFCRDAIMARAAEILAQRAPQSIVQYPAKSARVAEEPVKYPAKATGKK